MIKIQKGDSTLTVTHGAYKNYYKHLGYEPVGVAQTAENPGGENTHLTEDSQHCGDSTQLRTDEDTPAEGGEEFADGEDADEGLDLSEIPLSEMGLDQLREYADQLGLDHDGLRKRSELRALIREHLK